MPNELIPYPSLLIATTALQTIQENAAAAEQSGTLHPQQLNIIYQNKWFNLYVPREYGGLECTLMEALQTLEGIAYADGSTGWTVTLCSGANWFIGFLDIAIAQLLFSDPRVCFAGSGRASGIAEDMGNHYIINGSWNYASGASIATAFTANCQVKKNGALVLNAEGSPLIRSFVFLKEEVTLLPNWKYIGMTATASNGFAVNNVKVDKNRSFIISPENAVLPQPIFLYPFLHFAEATLAVNHSGMACRFLDCCSEIVNERKDEVHAYSHVIQTLADKLTSAKETLHVQRQAFYTAVQHSWNELIQFGNITEANTSAVSSNSRQLAATVRQITDELYPYCGLAAANPSTQINRVWRDLHTASQHVLLL